MIPLSYSRMSCFEQCETKFNYLYVDRTVKDSDNEFTIYGSRVHEALEKYGRGEAPLTEETEKYKGLVDSLMSQPGEKFFEHQMALDECRIPCEWFSKAVWLRGIADVLIINGDTAFVGDWKTGKVKDNPTQLKLFACMVMEHFPEVRWVKTAFIWLAHNDITSQTFDRAHLRDMWNTLTPRMDAVQDAVNLGVFRSKPTGLCNWCPAKNICPDKKRR